MQTSLFRLFRALLGFSALAGCGQDEGTGTLRVMLRAEDSIGSGLMPGDDLESVVDGWHVRFDAYLAAIGRVRIERSDGEAEPQRSERTVVSDLRRIDSRGVEIARFDGVAAGRWDVFEIETPHASEGAERDENADRADVDVLVDSDGTFLIEGTIESDEGQSCPPAAECRDASAIGFRFAVPAETLYGPCEAEDGLAGVAINEGGTTTVAVTVHGDHLFFDGFPMETERVERRAQWLADADLDGDNEVTQDELASIDAADLFDSDTYSFGAAPLPIETAWDFVRAQMKTVVHFQGEGECPVERL
jgi:hypothetical protein